MTPDRLFTPRFFWMCAFTFTVFLSLFQLIPTAPFHVRDLGGGSLATGLFLGFLTFASAWSGPFTGAFADRNGRRRTLIVASLGLAGFTALYSIIHNYRLLLVLVLLHGIVWSALLSASAAYLTGVLPPARRGEGIAYWGLSSVLAAAIAPSVGFWLYSHGWIYLCVVTTLLNLTMAVIAWCMEDDRGTAAAHGPRSGFIEWRVVALSAPLFLYSYSYGTVSSFSAVFADARGIHPKAIYLTAFAVTTLLTRPFLGRVGDRIGYRRIFLPSLVVMTPGDDRADVRGHPAGAGVFRVDVRARVRDGVPCVRRICHAGRRPRAPRRGVRRHPGGVRHRHRRRVNDERLADRAIWLSGRVRTGSRALGARASRVPFQRAPVRPSHRHGAATCRSPWP